jgi:hypothetical protein
VFSDEIQAESFHSGVLRIPKSYRKRKMSDSSMVVPNIEVDVQSVQKIASDVEFQRVFLMQYQKDADDPDESPEIDEFSHFSAVEIDEEVRLRLIEREDSKSLFWQKPHKCYLISQSRYKDVCKNPNNIVFMSRNLRHQFDAINSAVGIPVFYLSYASHSPAPVPGIVNGDPCQVYETTVNVVFKDEMARSVLGQFFKSHTVISLTAIQLVLYFPAPEEFKEFADIRTEETLARWRSFDGPEF